MWNALTSKDVQPAKVELALDHEHRHLNDLVNDLQHQLLYKASTTKQLTALHIMEAYLRVNCGDEEAIMDDCSFPLSRAHKEEHRSHYEAVRLIEADINASRVGDALAGVMALHQKLLAHIRDKDQELVDWKRRQPDGLRHFA